VDAEGAVIIGDEPQLAEFVHEKADAKPVVPIISARLSWLILAIIASGFPSRPACEEAMITGHGRRDEPVFGSVAIGSRDDHSAQGTMFNSTR
jgi:hypothetical protein